MSREIKRRIPIGLISVITAFFLIEYFAAPSFTVIHSVKGELTVWGTLIAGFMLIFGVFILLRHHFLQLAIRHAGWQDKVCSIVFFAAFLAFLAVGFSTPARVAGANYRWIYQYMYTPTGSAILALCFFWCVYGGYRTFTIKSWESAAIGLGAVIYMLRLLPIGPYYIPQLAPFGDWVLSTINVGATRGGTIAVGIAALILGFRTLIGKETSVLEATKE